MPCHPFRSTRSDVICFKLGNCYPFDYILCIYNFVHHVLSTCHEWVSTQNRNSTERNGHMNESHQLVSMNISIWDHSSTIVAWWSQLHSLTYIFLYSVGAVEIWRNSNEWNGIDILATASSIMLKLMHNVKMITNWWRVRWVCVSTIRKWTKCTPKWMWPCEWIRVSCTRN